MGGRYYDTTCCDEPMVPSANWDIKSFSHEFCGPTVLNNAALSGQSGSSGIIHQVDIDVRTDADAAIVLVRDSATDNLFCGGSRHWGGNLATDNVPMPSNDFALTLLADQCVVVSWEEIL